MATLNAVSLQRLATCDPRLQGVFAEVARIWRGELAVLCGHRGEAEQNQAFAEGRSKKRWPEGEHNALPSRAVDACPAELVQGVRKIDWADRERMNLFAGFVIAVGELRGIRIRWGGDWDRDTEVKDNTFDDLVHFELVE